MSDRIERQALIRLLQGDEEVIEHLCELGVLSRVDEFEPIDVEIAMVARTLVRELEVNWPGVEVIIRMRSELMETRKQVVDLLGLIGRREKPP